MFKAKLLWYDRRKDNSSSIRGCIGTARVQLSLRGKNMVEQNATHSQIIILPTGARQKQTSTMADEYGYRSSLAALMSFKHGVTHPSNAEFTRDELATVTPNDIVMFFNQRAYGMPTPPPDARPVHCRSNTLFYWKKAVAGDPEVLGEGERLGIGVWSHVHGGRSHKH